MIYEMLHDIPGVKMRRSESGFLSWLDISALGDSGEVVDYLIREAKVAVNAGENYGKQGKGYIRIVHGVLGHEDDWESAVGRMRGALMKLAAIKGVSLAKGGTNK